MNGKILIQALVQMSGDELRIVYALLHKTNILGMITAKTKDFFSKETDHFYETLKIEMDKLKRFSDEELQVKLFTEMTKVLELPGVPYHSSSEIEMQGEAVMQAVHKAMLKEDKDYGKFVEAANDREIYQLIIHYQMQKVFSTFDSKFRELDEKKTTDFIKKIQTFLMELPEEKQLELKARLKLDELTTDAIRSALLIQGSVVVFSVIVEVAGFTAYTVLTSAMAATLALAGITWPFGFYTFAASLFSMLVNPLIILPLALGGGGLLLKHQNKSMKKKLLPVAILQMILPLVVQARIGEADFSSFITHWEKQAGRYYELVEKRTQYEAAIHDQEAEMKDYEEQREIHVQAMEAEKEKAKTYKMFIGSHIAAIPAEEGTPALQQGIEILATKEKEIAVIEQQKGENRERKGLWRTIGATIDNTKLNIRKNQLQKEIEEKQQELVEEVLLSEGNFMQNEREILMEHRMNAKKQREKALIYDEKVTVAKEKSKELKNRVKLVDEQIKQLQHEYYGLENMGKS
ncbi:hypothetical protein [Lysinibacillus odysseyi]|uniref:Uncharacterized protein n=1 Tax=Lysinibacillus odysseyi 34hs-1 = NBRC 100172 TaxID=1220589 RepID=A0A0A3IYI9_9BACI|nr:hypothetical protein [Lysinibacillus odysseyi]KGR88525.1 hypothetical protein CD32_01575 [Lysinibacillus odysseyi 34hs-1 = NBRC 100172]